MISLSNLSSKQLRRAAKIKDKIQSLEGDLSRMLGGGVSSGKQNKGKRKMSAVGRAKIAAAARARWAKVKAAGKKRL